MTKMRMDLDEIGRAAQREALADGVWALWVPTKVSMTTKEKDDREPHKAGNMAIVMRTLPLQKDGDLKSAMSRYAVNYRLWLPFKNEETLDDEKTLRYPLHKAPNTGGLVVEFVDATELTKLPAAPERTKAGWFVDGAPAGISDVSARQNLRARTAAEYIFDLVQRGEEAMTHALTRVAFYGQSEVDGQGYGGIRNLRPRLPDGGVYGPVPE